MGITTKTRISSNLITVKIVCGVSVFTFLKLLVENRNTDLDFKTITEYKIYLIVSIVFLLYFFTRPIISHDDVNLYIKKVNKKEMAIPLKRIQSIFVVTIGGRGTSNNSIEYLGNDNVKDTVRFNASYASRLSNFIELVRRHNPRVEII